MNHLRNIIGYCLPLLVIATICNTDNSIKNFSNKVETHGNFLPSILSLPQNTIKGSSSSNLISYSPAYYVSNKEIVLLEISSTDKDCIMLLKNNNGTLYVDTLSQPEEYNPLLFDKDYLITSVRKSGESGLRYQYLINVTTGSNNSFRSSAIKDFIVLNDNSLILLASDLDAASAYFMRGVGLPLSINRLKEDSVKVKFAEPFFAMEKYYEGCFKTNDLFGIYVRLKGEEHIRHAFLYNYDGQLIREPQAISLGMPKFKKDGAYFVEFRDFGLNNTLYFWQLDKVDKSFRITATYNIEGYKLGDYALYNDSIYLSLWSKDSNLFVKLPIKGEYDYEYIRNNSIITTWVERVVADEDGIFLKVNSDNFFEKPTDDDLKNLSMIGIKEGKALQFFGKCLGKITFYRIEHNSSRVSDRKDYSIKFNQKNTLINYTVIPCVFGNREMYISYNYEKNDIVGYEGFFIEVGEFNYFYDEKRKLLWNHQNKTLTEAKGDLSETLTTCVEYFFQHSKNLKLYEL